MQLHTLVRLSLIEWRILGKLALNDKTETRTFRNGTQFKPIIKEKKQSKRKKENIKIED